MEIRLMQKGEERLWVQAGARDSEVEERLTRFLDRQRSYPEDPVCFIVAMDGRRCIGKLRGLIPHNNLYLINSIVVIATENEEQTSQALIDYALLINNHRRVEAFNWKTAADAKFDHYLRHAGFAVYIEKTLVRRTLTDFTNSYRDPFSYKTFSESGLDAFVAVMSEVDSLNPNRDAMREDAAAGLAELIELAGSAFNGELWKLAFFDDRPAGFILPQIFSDDLSEGSIFNMGLSPAYRGRGLGKILHAKGLEVLKRFGAATYIGSTDVLNLPMVKVFEANGCATIGVRRIYRQHEHESVDV